MDFFRRKPVNQYYTGRHGVNLDTFKYENVTRKEINQVATLSDKWNVNSNLLFIKTLANINFKKDDAITLDNKKYIIDSVYTEDEDMDINSPLFKSQRSYKYIALRY